MPVIIKAIEIEIRPERKPREARRALNTGRYGARKRSSITKTETARLVDSLDSSLESLINCDAIPDEET